MCKRASAVVLCAAVLAMIVACAPTIAAQSPRIVDSVATLPPRPANTDPGHCLQPRYSRSPINSPTRLPGRSGSAIDPPKCREIAGRRSPARRSSPWHGPTGWLADHRIAHGTTGIDPGCAPSRVADLMGSDTLIAGFLQAGYAVVATDYQRALTVTRPMMSTAAGLCRCPCAPVSGCADGRGECHRLGARPAQPHPYGLETLGGHGLSQGGGASGLPPVWPDRTVTVWSSSDR